MQGEGGGGDCLQIFIILDVIEIKKLNVSCHISHLYTFLVGKGLPALPLLLYEDPLYWLLPTLFSNFVQPLSQPSGSQNLIELLPSAQSSSQNKSFASTY